LNEQTRPARIVPTLEQFPGRTDDIIRFGDLDPQGHVNNTVFATYFETGRVTLLRGPSDLLNPPGATSVLAQLDIRFLREMHWPGTVDIGTGVLKVGRSSFTLAQGLFSKGHLAAAAEATIVMVDKETRRSTPLPPRTLDLLRSLMLTDNCRT
jgi:acyl-CoA thioester hydrolase